MGRRRLRKTAPTAPLVKAQQLLVCKWGFEAMATCVDCLVENCMFVAGLDGGLHFCMSEANLDAHRGSLA